jgi:hypothetical protein
VRPADTSQVRNLQQHQQWHEHVKEQALLGEAVMDDSGLRALPRDDDGTDTSATAQAPPHPVDINVPGAMEASAAADYELEAELYNAALLGADPSQPWLRALLHVRKAHALRRARRCDQQHATARAERESGRGTSALGAVQVSVRASARVRAITKHAQALTVAAPCRFSEALPEAMMATAAFPRFTDGILACAVLRRCMSLASIAHGFLQGTVPARASPCQHCSVLLGLFLGCMALCTQCLQC